MTIEDIRNRIALARAHGDVAAHAIINNQPKRAQEAIKNTTEYWKQAVNMLESYLAEQAQPQTPKES